MWSFAHPKYQSMATDYFAQSSIGLQIDMVLKLNNNPLNCKIHTLGMAYPHSIFIYLKKVKI